MKIKNVEICIDGERIKFPPAKGEVYLEAALNSDPEFILESGNEVSVLVIRDGIYYTLSYTVVPDNAPKLETVK